MFYKNKKTGKVVELIYSDSSYCIIVPLEDITNVEGELNGSIVYGTKKDFKNDWKKFKTDVEGLEQEAIESVIATFLFDKRRFTNDEKVDELVVLTQQIYENGQVN